MDENDARATTPICTPSDVALLVGMPRSTVYDWLKPRPSRPYLIHHIPPETRGWPSIPLLGLAEAAVLRAMRDNGMKMPEIAAAVDYLRDKDGPYALGRPELLHDGFQAYVADGGNLQTLRGGQLVLMGLVDQYLQPFRIAPDGFVEAYLVERIPGVEIDPRFQAGRMRFTRTGVPVFAIAGALEAGEDPHVVATEYGLLDHEVGAVQQQLEWLSTAA